MKRFSIFILILSGLFILGSCKKDKDDGAPPPPPPPTRIDLMKDTALAYSREIYLWYDQIPSNLDARSFPDLDALMMAIRNYSREPGFTRPVDEWSFAIDQATWDNTSSGIVGDLGIEVFFHDATDLRVKSVEPKSPAGLQGVRRGWRIVAINGNSQNIIASEPGINFIINNIYLSNSATITFRKPDNDEVTLTLNAAQYQTTPVVLDTVYTISGVKIGYLSFQSFLGDTNQIFNDFSRIFSKFESENIFEIIVDLRYNGGGYVNVQDKLANYLVPSSADNQVMMKQEFNALFSDWNETTYFSKIGNLNLPRIYFIVTENTASASELLINNLEPFMEVRIVGRSPSYGKPVGYFPIPVGDWYIFPVSFRSTNSEGLGNYFDGFIPDIIADDNVTKDWGDLEESSLAAAINEIISLHKTGAELAGRAAMIKVPEVDENVIKANRALSENEFKGMVDIRRREFK